MNCSLCGHTKVHKHGKRLNGHQRYLCPACGQTFSENFDSLYYRRQVNPEQIRQVLQAIVKEVVCAGLVELLSWPTTRLSVLFAQPVKEHN